MVHESRVKVQRLFPCRDLEIPYGYKIKVKILNIQINRSTAQANGVGENPLNGKGVTAIIFIYNVVKK